MKKEIIPHLSFRVAKYEDIQYMLHKSIEEDIFDGAVLRKYTSLKEKLEGVTDKDKRKEIEKSFFIDTISQNKKELEEKAVLFQEEWDRFEEGVMKTLSDIVEQEWLEHNGSFDVRVSINPICPRYLTLHAFDIFYGQDAERMKATATHELLHFIYFDKFKDIFPEIPEKEYNTPHLAWHLSEIVPGVILNDERIQKIFVREHTSYKHYYEIKIEGKSLMKHIQDIYDSKKDFEDFVRKSWEFVNVNKELIL